MCHQKVVCCDVFYADIKGDTDEEVDLGDILTGNDSASPSKSYGFCRPKRKPIEWCADVLADRRRPDIVEASTSAGGLPECDIVTTTVFEICDECEEIWQAVEGADIFLRGHPRVESARGTSHHYNHWTARSFLLSRKTARETPDGGETASRQTTAGPTAGKGRRKATAPTGYRLPARHSAASVVPHQQAPPPSFALRGGRTSTPPSAAQIRPQQQPLQRLVGPAPDGSRTHHPSQPGTPSLTSGILPRGFPRAQDDLGTGTSALSGQMGAFSKNSYQTPMGYTSGGQQLPHLPHMTAVHQGRNQWLPDGTDRSTGWIQPRQSFDPVQMTGPGVPSHSSQMWQGHGGLQPAMAPRSNPNLGFHM